MDNRVESKIDNIVEDVNEVKIAITKLEGGYERSVEILDRLTSSVEHHIKRTDELQNIVIDSTLKLALVEQRIEDDKARSKLIYMVLAVVGTIILGLKQLGILDKLL